MSYSIQVLLVSLHHIQLLKFYLHEPQTHFLFPPKNFFLHLSPAWKGLKMWQQLKAAVLFMEALSVIRPTFPTVQITRNQGGKNLPSDLLEPSEGLKTDPQSENIVCGGDSESQGGCGAQRTQSCTLFHTALTKTSLLFLLFHDWCRAEERDRPDSLDSDNIFVPVSKTRFINQETGHTEYLCSCGTATCLETFFPM